MTRRMTNPRSRSFSTKLFSVNSANPQRSLRLKAFLVCRFSNSWEFAAKIPSASLLPATRKMNHRHRIFPLASPRPFFGDVVFVFEAQNQPLFVSDGGRRQIARSYKLEI